MAQAVPIPDQVDASATMGDNIRTLLEARLSRPLSAGEIVQLDIAITEALSVLSSGAEGARQELLASTMATALMISAVAQLWACAVHVLSGVAPSSVASFASALLDSTGAVVGAQLAGGAFGP